MVLTSWKYSLLAFGIALLSFAAYIAFPALTIPGNSFEFQVQNTSAVGIAMLIALAGLTGLLIAMQVYAFRNCAAKGARVFGTGTVAWASTFVTSIFSTATCAACAGAVFSFLGAQGVFFLLGHRWEIVLLGIGLLILSMEFVSRQIEHGCALNRATPLSKGRP